MEYARSNLIHLCYTNPVRVARPSRCIAPLGRNAAGEVYGVYEGGQGFTLTVYYGGKR